MTLFVAVAKAYYALGKNMSAGSKWKSMKLQYQMVKNDYIKIEKQVMSYKTLLFACPGIANIFILEGAVHLD